MHCPESDSTDRLDLNNRRSGRELWFLNRRTSDLSTSEWPALIVCGCVGKCVDSGWRESADSTFVVRWSVVDCVEWNDQ